MRILGTDVLVKIESRAFWPRFCIRLVYIECIDFVSHCVELDSRSTSIAVDIASLTNNCIKRML